MRSSKKNRDYSTHIIYFFSSHQSLVIDPYSGTMSVMIVCMESGPKFMCIDHDCQCFRFAIGRCRVFSTPGRCFKLIMECADSGTNAPISKSSKRFLDCVGLDETEVNGNYRWKHIIEAMIEIIQ